MSAQSMIDCASSARISSWLSRTYMAALLLGRDDGGIEVGEVDLLGEVDGVLARHRAVGEGAQHVVVRHARHVAGGIKSRNGGARKLIDIHTRCGVAGAEADLRDVH